MMEIFTTEFLVALMSIIIIDLVLAGDNAIVIGMSAKNLPVHQRKKAIIIGTAGAVVVRIAATLAIVWLLKIPGLQLVGGLILVWIAYKLLVDDAGVDDNHKASTSLASAIATIMIADTIMGLDNVLAVAGAANHDYLLVVIGLIISVPIMVWGSTMFMKLIDRFPIIIYIGSAVLAFTAAKMITHEPFLKTIFSNSVVIWGFVAVIVAGVLFLGKKKADKIKEA